MENRSGIKPLEFKVVILPETVEAKTAGGLFMPETVREKEQMAAVRGTLVAMSPHAFEEFDKAKPSVGDRVLIAKYGGQVFQGLDGETYRILNDKDILAILEG
jgi:chaperonin GroES